MNARKYCVYMHKNKINGKVYIGATCLRINARWGKNGSQYKRQKCFYSDIIKYGWENFEHIVLDKDLSYNQSKSKEIYYINQYKDNCYNKTKGGEQGKIKHLSQEEYNKKYEDMKNKIIKYGKEHHKELAEKSKKYYYENEEYHKRKIEYQREYRRKHKVTN